MKLSTKESFSFEAKKARPKSDDKLTIKHPTISSTRPCVCSTMSLDDAA